MVFAPHFPIHHSVQFRLATWLRDTGKALQKLLGASWYLHFVQLALSENGVFPRIICYLKGDKEVENPKVGFGWDFPQNF